MSIQVKWLVIQENIIYNYDIVFCVNDLQSQCWRINELMTELYKNAGNEVYESTNWVHNCDKSHNIEVLPE